MVVWSAHKPVGLAAVQTEKKTVCTVHAAVRQLHIAESVGSTYIYR